MPIIHLMALVHVFMPDGIISSGFMTYDLSEVLSAKNEIRYGPVQSPRFPKFSEREIENFRRFSDRYCCPIIWSIQSFVSLHKTTEA